MPSSPLTEAERADVDERAAILEFDANLPRPEAERQALAMILRARTSPPRRLPLSGA